MNRMFARLAPAGGIIFALFISTSNFSSLAQADDTFDEENWEHILGLPPEPGSIEEKEDVDTLLKFQSTRTNAECAQAASEEKVSLETFFGGDKGPLSKKEVSHLKLVFFKYLIKGGLKTSSAKNYFDRPRPFETFSEIKPCIKLAKGQSYPSGHTSISRLMAYVLSAKFPERRVLFFKRADEIARDRMLGGVHYPSDVRAGKHLGDLFAKKWLDDDDFMKAIGQ